MTYEAPILQKNLLLTIIKAVTNKTT